MTTGNARIKIVGIGGCGVNTVNRIVENAPRGVETIAINTDSHSLAGITADTKLLIGRALTRGLGAGGDPDTGQRAAEENASEIRDALLGVDTVIIIAGLGGGTGTGAAPVVARIARDLGAFTLGIAYLPFQWEGKRRISQAESGAIVLEAAVDKLVTRPNDALLSRNNSTASIADVFNQADQLISEGVQRLIQARTTGSDDAEIEKILSDYKLILDTPSIPTNSAAPKHGLRKGLLSKLIK